MKVIKGCAYLCEFNGTVCEVLRDDFSITKNHAVEKLFTSLLDEESTIKALDFLMEIREKRVAFDYRLNFQIENSVKSLYFLGVNLTDKTLIIGADNHTEAINFSNHLYTINNEQSNLIRGLIKEKSLSTAQRDKETEELLDELSKVNNESINLQRELNKKNKELERLNDIKNKFMGIASHDLRNPLHVVQMYTDFLVDEASDNLNEEHQDFLKVINSSARFMIGLVNDLLEYSKIEAGTIQLNIECFDLVKVLDGMVNFMKVIALKKNIIINFKHTVSKASINADMYKIEQLFNNLIGNAIKFSHLDSAINIELSKQEDNYLITVSNYGKGIDTANKEVIFRPFQKIAAKGTGNEAGSGLGLFIVKQIVDNHKGRIWYESEPNKRTTFYVELPQQLN